jgi:hypothetical protein
MDEQHKTLAHKVSQQCDDVLRILNEIDRDNLIKKIPDSKLRDQFRRHVATINKDFKSYKGHLVWVQKEEESRLGPLMKKIDKSSPEKKLKSLEPKFQRLLRDATVILKGLREQKCVK